MAPRQSQQSQRLQQSEEISELRSALSEHIKQSTEWQGAMIKMMQEYHEMVNERLESINPIVESLNAGRIAWRFILGLLGFFGALSALILTIKQIYGK